MIGPGWSFSLTYRRSSPDLKHKVRVPSRDLETDTDVMIGKHFVTVRARSGNCGVRQNNVGDLKILIDNGIKRLPPILFRVVHHQVYKDGEQKRQNGGTIANLRSIHTAIPGRAAMDELVAQDV